MNLQCKIYVYHECFNFQIERFVDRKIDKAEELLKKNQRKAKKWYHGITGEDEFKLKEIHIFIGAFAAGLALGMAAA